jgi:hypothetical protein
MKSRRQTGFMRRVATIAAITLLLAQMIAAAHYHRVAVQQEVASSAGAGIADTSCAICAAHFHSPVTSAVVPALDTPTALDAIVPIAVQTGPLSTLIPKLFGRAPPASV